MHIINDDVIYISGFMSIEKSDELFKILLNDPKWHNELRTIDGSVKKIKRKMAYVYDRVVDYKYGNFILPGDVWTDTLSSVKYLIEAASYGKFNSVLLNLYEDGKDEIKWHSDKEEQLGPNPVIASLNLGATRNFHMLKKETGEKIKIPLSNGDLLVMGKDCQQNWLHAILPEKEIKEPRISLTFRWVHDDIID